MNFRAIFETSGDVSAEELNNKFSPLWQLGEETFRKPLLLLQGLLLSTARAGFESVRMGLKSEDLSITVY